METRAHAAALPKDLGIALISGWRGAGPAPSAPLTSARKSTVCGCVAARIAALQLDPLRLPVDLRPGLIAAPSHHAQWRPWGPES